MQPFRFNFKGENLKKYFIIAIIALIAAAYFINTDKKEVKQTCCADSLAALCSLKCADSLYVDSLVVDSNQLMAPKDTVVLR